MQLFSGETFDLSQVLKANIVFKKLDNTTSSYIWEEVDSPTSPTDKSFDDFFPTTLKLRIFSLSHIRK